MIKSLIPTVRVDSKTSYHIAKAIHPPVIVVRVQDVISKKTGEPNSIFTEIVEAGGIHNFLNYEGFVILSLIMKDDLIWLFSSEKYAQIINGLLPDAYTTVDGATYENREIFSERELIRLSKQTIELLHLCPHILPIGQVKGSTSRQIQMHLKLLENLGIEIFLFHTGDFLRQGDRNMIQKAKHFASLIKKKGHTLILSGMGAQRHLTSFSFADAFITYSHIVNAQHGKRFEGTRKIKSFGGKFVGTAIHNLKQMILNLKKIQTQTKLYSGGELLWAEAQQEQSKELVILGQVEKIKV